MKFFISPDLRLYKQVLFKKNNLKLKQTNHYQDHHVQPHSRLRCSRRFHSSTWHHKLSYSGRNKPSRGSPTNWSGSLDQAHWLRRMAVLLRPVRRSQDSRSTKRLRYKQAHLLLGLVSRAMDRSERPLGYHCRPQLPKCDHHFNHFRFDFRRTGGYNSCRWWYSRGIYHLRLRKQSYWSFKHCAWEHRLSRTPRLRCLAQHCNCQCTRDMVLRLLLPVRRSICLSWPR